jgi:predicted component of type VI protein secretion system
MSVIVTFFLIHDAGQHKYVLDAPGQYVVGRDESCSLAIPRSFDASISHQHCRIIVTADGVHIRDAGSSNGTFINERQLPDGRHYADSPNIEVSDAPISSGDVVKVGNSRFHVEITTNDSVEVSTPEVATKTPLPTAPVALTHQAPSHGAIIMPREKAKPAAVNGWITLPPKKGRKPLIRVN